MFPSLYFYSRSVEYFVIKFTVNFVISSIHAISPGTLNLPYFTYETLDGQNQLMLQSGYVPYGCVCVRVCMCIHTHTHNAHAHTHNAHAHTHTHTHTQDGVLCVIVYAVSLTTNPSSYHCRFFTECIMFVPLSNHTHTHTHTHIQSVPGGMCQISGGFSLC